MATKPLFSLLVFLLIAAATTTVVSGRPGIPFHPCNTLIISTYSFSLHHPQNPNSDVVFIDLLPLRHPRHHLRVPQLIPMEDKTSADAASADLPPAAKVGFSSLKERTEDILSVVASLLFGAFCGALTASTMYLVWSLLNYCRTDYASLHGFNSDDDNDNDDVFNPKKNSHYVAIPSSAPVKDNEAA